MDNYELVTSSLSRLPEKATHVVLRRQEQRDAQHRALWRQVPKIVARLPGVELQREVPCSIRHGSGRARH